jgi:hypothetical protein
MAEAVGSGRRTEEAGEVTTTWPQPHEGITGADRDDWLLSLDEQAVPHREALIMMARHLRGATLVGNPAPVVRRMGERICRPQPGDLVVAAEVLHGRRDLDSRTKGLGIFLAARREWAETDAEWGAFCEEERAAFSPDDLALICSEENRCTDDVYYIQYGPAAGDVCRWSDSSCTVLPVQVDSFAVDAAAERTGTSATFTRDSLTAGLADSGFTFRSVPLSGEGGQS